MQLQLQQQYFQLLSSLQLNANCIVIVVHFSFVRRFLENSSNCEQFLLFVEKIVYQLNKRFGRKNFKFWKIGGIHTSKKSKKMFSNTPVSDKILCSLLKSSYLYIVHVCVCGCASSYQWFDWIQNHLMWMWEVKANSFQ